MNTDILNTNISSLKFLTSDQNDKPQIKGIKKKLAVPTQKRVTNAKTRRGGGGEKESSKKARRRRAERVKLTGHDS